MTELIIPTAHLARVYELLIGAYGVPKNEPDYDPLGGLVGTILSQHTSDINSDRAYQQLVSTFPTWEEVRDAPTHIVAETIRTGGLANIKAVRIQDTLLTLTEEQQKRGGTKSLSDYLYDELTMRTSEDTWQYLRSMPGVGPKTAACVLMFNLDRPVMPVETGKTVNYKLFLKVGFAMPGDMGYWVFLTGFWWFCGFQRLVSAQCAVKSRYVVPPFFKKVSQSRAGQNTCVFQLAPCLVRKGESQLIRW